MKSLAIPLDTRNQQTNSEEAYRNKDPAARAEKRLRYCVGAGRTCQETTQHLITCVCTAIGEINKLAAERPAPVSPWFLGEASRFVEGFVPALRGLPMRDHLPPGLRFHRSNPARRDAMFKLTDHQVSEKLPQEHRIDRAYGRHPCTASVLAQPSYAIGIS